MNTQNNVTPKQWSISNGKLKIFYILANIFWVLSLFFDIYGLIFDNTDIISIYLIAHLITAALLGVIVNAVLFSALNKKKVKLFYTMSIIFTILGFFWLGVILGICVLSSAARALYSL